MSELKAPEILEAIRKIENRGAVDIAQRVRQRCSAVFAYATGAGLVEGNPVAAMKGVFATRRKEPRKMLPAGELPTFLQKLRCYNGDRTVQIGLRLIVLTMVRTVELRGARWSEFDFESNCWSIPAERLKMRAPHRVLLSRHAVASLAELKKITGSHDLLFPSRSDHLKPISENTLLYALYRMGYHQRADSPKSAIAMLPRRPFRRSGKLAQTACKPARRDGKSSIPWQNHVRTDLGIPKIRHFATFRIDGAV